jgi:tRNA pseudouridine55 synthase
MDGVLLIDKPEGPTSHDVVARLRRILGVRKIGHFGTLDPFASGLLVVGVGRATRLCPFFSVSDKTYEGRLRFGIATDTYDRTGRPTSSAPPPWPDAAAVDGAISGFVGEISQLPPPFSAKKLRGRPLYAFARRGQETERRPCPVTVWMFDRISYDPPDLAFRVRCSSGTYVRSLAHDLGARLGCGAHLTDLVRLAAGPFLREESFPLETIQAMAEEGRVTEVLRPLEGLLPHFPKAVLTPEGMALVGNGRSIGPAFVAASEGGEPGPGAPGPLPVRLFSPDGRLAALARPGPDGATLAPFLVLI